MTKNELVLAVSGASNIPPEAVGRMLNAILDTIIESIGSGDTVTLPGFGTFSRKHRDARICRNPRTGESIGISACNVPSFKPGKRLKEAANS